MKQLVNALKDGGATLGGADPRKTLYVSMVRNPLKEFVSPKQGFMGLREFYKSLPRSEKRPTGRSARRKPNPRQHRKMGAIIDKGERDGQDVTRLRAKERVRQFLAEKGAHNLDEITKDVSAHMGQPIKKSVIWGILRSKDFIEESGRYRMAR